MVPWSQTCVVSVASASDIFRAQSTCAHPSAGRGDSAWLSAMSSYTSPLLGIEGFLRIFAALNHILMNIPAGATTFIRFVSVSTGIGRGIQRDVEFLNPNEHPTMVPVSIFTIAGSHQSCTVLPTIRTKGGFLFLYLHLFRHG